VKRAAVVLSFISALLVVSAMAPALAQTPLNRADFHARQMTVMPRVNPCLQDGTSWCDYVHTSFSTLCGGAPIAFVQGTFNMATIGCRNIDESLATDNRFTNLILRLYYSPNAGGAHACLGKNAQISNLTNTTFNHNPGQPGYGQSVFNNVASVTWTPTPCS
jgi:hypothetical protein